MDDATKAKVWSQLHSEVDPDVRALLEEGKHPVGLTPDRQAVCIVYAMSEMGKILSGKVDRGRKAEVQSLAANVFGWVAVLPEDLRLFALRTLAQNSSRDHVFDGIFGYELTKVPAFMKAYLLIRSLREPPRPNEGAAAPYQAKWTLSWVRARVRMKHHAALATWLVQRTDEQAAEADAAGLTVNAVLAQAFDVKNGHTAVPQDAMKVLRHVPGTDVLAVARIVMASLDRRQHAALRHQLDNLVRAGKLVEGDALREVRGLLVVKSVLEE